MLNDTGEASTDGSWSGHGTGWLPTASACARLIAVRDWSDTPLGPLANWPQSLRTALGLLLNSPVPMVMLWGEDGTMLYNDAYSAFAGGRHPQLLGSKVREGWPEVADFNDHVMKVGLAGGTLSYTDQELTLHRDGRPELVAMNLDYSPVPGDDGRPAGVLAIVIETTKRLAAERRQREAEAALREREAQLRGVLNNMGESFVLLDHDFRLIDINPEALKGETRPASEMLGKTHWELWPGSEDAPQGRLYRKALADRIAVECETHYEWPDGREAWFEVRAYPVPDGLAIFYRDITDRRSTEEALRLVAEKTAVQAAEQEAILGQLSEGVIVADAQGHVAFINDAAERLHGVRMLGVPPEQYSNTYALMTEDGQPYPPLELPLARAVRGETVSDARWRIRRPDGTEVLAIGNAKPVQGLDGAQIGAVLTIRDDTQRRAAEAALGESEERYRTLFEAIEVGFCIVEMKFDESGTAVDYRMVEINPAFEKHTGLRGAHGKWVSEIVPDLERYWHEIYGRVALTGEPVRFENQAGPMEGRWFDVYAFRTGAPEQRRVAILFNDISERRRAEVTLRESETRFRNMADHAPVMMWVTEPDGSCTYLNRSWYEFTGQTPGQAEGFGWLEAVHPDDRAGSEEVFLKANAKQEPFQIEQRLRRHDGEYRWVIDAASPRFGPTGEFLGYIGSVIDIDERRDAEDALRVKSEEFYALADNIPTLAWMARADGHIFWYNRRWYDYTGTTPESQEGWGWEMVHHPDWLPSVVERWTHSLETGTSFEMTFPLKGADGIFRPFLTRIVPIRDEAGAIVRWFGTNTDVDEQTRAEERLREVSRRLDAVLNNTMMAVFVMDHRQHCIFANKAAEELTGYSFEELQTRPLHDLIHNKRPDGSPYPIDECPIDRAFPEDNQVQGEDLFVHKDGSFYPVAFTASPIHDEGSRTIGTIIEARDITEQRARAAELAEALQAKEVLLHEVNHRVKNSLQVVTGLLMLQAGQASDPELRQGLLEARGRIAVVASMHQRLYSTSEHDRVDFGEYIRELAVETLSSLGGEEKITLNKTIEPGIMVLLQQAVPLALVVSELLTNAVKYAFPDNSRGTIGLSLQRSGDQIVLEVCDDGVGLPPEFDPAERKGLGMRIVTSLVKQVRGKLAVERRDEGALFRIDIPANRIQ